MCTAHKGASRIPSRPSLVGTSPVARHGGDVERAAVGRGCPPPGQSSEEMSSGVPAVGLSHCHIRTNTTPDQPECTVRIAQGGRYTRIMGTEPIVTAERKTVPRGEIRTFSSRSRRRLLNFLAQFNEKATPHVAFLTLTYPGEYTRKRKEWYEHIKRFDRELERRYGRAWSVWKLEPQKRGAPHFHLLIGFDQPQMGLHFMDDGEDFQSACRWVAETWYRIVGSNDPRHLRAGTRLEPMRSWDGVMSYASKYLGKETSMPDWWEPGRFWGKFGTPPIEFMDEPITPRHAVHLKRLARRYLRSKGFQLRTRVPGGLAIRWKEKTAREALDWADSLVHRTDSLTVHMKAATLATCQEEQVVTQADPGSNPTLSLSG